MSDIAPAEEHQQLASSRYAKVIVYLCGFIALGLIASDRQTSDTLAMRHELVKRRVHAQEMIKRAEMLRTGDELFFVNLCYDHFGGQGVVERLSGDELFATQASDIPTGILGNHELAPYTRLPGNKWELPDEIFVQAVSESAREIKGLLSVTGGEQVVRVSVITKIRQTIAKLSELALLEAWKKTLHPSQDEAAARNFIAMALKKARDAPREPQFSAEFVQAHVTGALQAVWKEKGEVKFDEATANDLVHRVFQPIKAGESPMSPMTELGLFEDSIETFAQAAVRTLYPELGEDQLSWIVCGQIRYIDLDSESHDSPILGLGYVEKPRAVSDLPVFSAYAFIGMLPADVAKTLRAYQSATETVLLAKAATESPIEVLGSGVSLRLFDLILFAGPLLALFQVLYLISLQQERRRNLRASPDNIEPDYPAFPRFSSPADPLSAPLPSTAEAALERALYFAFLVIPPVVVFFAWLTQFQLSGFRQFLHSPFWSSGFSLAEINRASNAGGFASTLYVLAIGVSCYALHRALLAGYVKLPDARWSRIGLVWRSCLATAAMGFYLAVRGGQKEYYLGGVLFLVVSAVAVIWDKVPERRRLVQRAAMGLFMAMIAITVVGYFISGNPEDTTEAIHAKRLWNPLFFFAPVGTNVLAPTWVISAGFFAALRRKQRLSLFFFALAGCALVMALLN